MKSKARENEKIIQYRTSKVQESQWKLYIISIQSVKKKWEIVGLASVSFFSEEYRANKDVMAEQSKLSDWFGSGPHHREHARNRHSPQVPPAKRSSIFFLSPRLQSHSFPPSSLFASQHFNFDPASSKSLTSINFLCDLPTNKNIPAAYYSTVLSSSSI